MAVMVMSSKAFVCKDVVETPRLVDLNQQKQYDKILTVPPRKKNLIVAEKNVLKKSQFTILKEA